MNIEPRKPSENQILNHDFFIAQRSYLVNKEIYSGEKQKDYKIAPDRILRLRIFHPDNDEHIMGSDLVYEQYDLVNEKVRLVHLQYKVWDEKDVLYFSQGNLPSQLDKLTKNICNNKLCHNSAGSNYSGGYRLPFCSAFLRPTDIKQSPESSLVTSGLHCPVCRIQSIRKDEKKITKNKIRDMSIGHSIFEEMFVYNMLGSRWLSFDELEDYYDSIGIEAQMNTIRTCTRNIR